MALYILQTIVVEILLKKGVLFCYKLYHVGLSQSFVNIVGYLIAPAISFFIIMGLMVVIQKIKSVDMVKYAFGFRMK